MAKLYFRHGTVSSGKSLVLLAAVHSYDKTHTDKKAIIIKPSVDIRNGDNAWSRTGLSKKADYNLTLSDSVPLLRDLKGVSCIFVDECQFLTVVQIEDLWRLSVSIPVICYGLRTDYQGHLFAASKRLFELADNIEEIKSVCKVCEKKAVFNMKVQDGKPIFTGGTKPDLGTEDKYWPVCKGCFISGQNNS